MLLLLYGRLFGRMGLFILSITAIRQHQHMGIKIGTATNVIEQKVTGSSKATYFS